MKDFRIRVNLKYLSDQIQIKKISWRDDPDEFDFMTTISPAQWTALAKLVRSEREHHISLGKLTKLRLGKLANCQHEPIHVRGIEQNLRDAYRTTACLWSSTPHKPKFVGFSRRDRTSSDKYFEVTIDDIPPSYLPRDQIDFTLSTRGDVFATVTSKMLNRVTRSVRLHGFDSTEYMVDGACIYAAIVGPHYDYSMDEEPCIRCTEQFWKISFDDVDNLCRRRIEVMDSVERAWAKIHAACLEEEADSY